MSRLCSDHQDREIAIPFDLLQPFHHLESVHAGHLEIEQNQTVTILAVQFADLARISRGLDAGITGDAQHALQQKDVGWLIDLNNQDASVQECLLN